jgi:hypothetical protein
MIVIALADGLSPPPEGMLDALADPLAGPILRTAALAALLLVPFFVVSRLKLKDSTLSFAVRFTFALICLTICLYLSTFLHTTRWRGPSRYDRVNYARKALERTPGHFSPVFLATLHFAHLSFPSRMRPAGPCSFTRFSCSF